MIPSAMPTWLLAGPEELAERDEVGVVRLVDPPAPHDVLVAEVAEMRDRPAEGCETQARGGAEDLEQGTTAVAHR